MDFTVLGICKDDTQTLRKGASKAPDLIRGVFPKLETYVNGVDLAEHFIEDLGNVEKIPQLKGFPIILGGEHTITLEGVRAVSPKAVVILDAHPDCEDKEGHMGVTRKIKEEGFPVYLYGVRVWSKAEEKYMKPLLATLEDLKGLKDVYLSIDLDIFDPAVLRAVGNPEPSGLSFNDVMKVVRLLAPQLRAVDFVEFTPTEKDNDIHNIFVGKLIYSVMAEVAKVRR